MSDLTIIDFAWRKVFTFAILFGLMSGLAGAAFDDWRGNDVEGCTIDQRPNEIVITCNEDR